MRITKKCKKDKTRNGNDKKFNKLTENKKIEKSFFQVSVTWFGSSLTYRM